MRLKKQYIVAIVLILLLFLIITLVNNRNETVTISSEDQISIKADQTSNIPIYISTGDKVINAAKIEIEFDPSQIQVHGISTKNSIFTLWVDEKPSYSNEDGVIIFEGGVPTPGFSGSGQIGEVKISGKLCGVSKLIFNKNSKVLLNDGLGSEVNVKFEDIVIKIDE